MDNPIPLNPGIEIGRFLEFLYRDETGLVYVPTKDPKTEEWDTHFFSWPNDRDLIVKHVLDSTQSLEVYIGPALYNEGTRKPTKENIKGSYVLWTEFDGALPSPTAKSDLPSPTLRVRSSESDHEHWYWALDHFVVDTRILERNNRGLTYTLGADASAWDATQILRPPSTHNHKRDKVVITLTQSQTLYSLELFDTIKEVPEALEKEINLDSIPDALDVVAKYQWGQEAFGFFRKRDIPTGERSSALMRLGYYCAEMRMLDEEAYAILANADDRWKKFTNRSDRQRRLLDIVNRARIKYPLSVDEGEQPWLDEFAVYDFMSFMETELNIEWLIPNLLQKGGTVVCSGPPAAGKSTLSLRFAINLALGKSFLGWSAGEPGKIMYVSMEMGHAELKHFLSQMDETLSENERETLRENLHLIPLGYGVDLSRADNQKIVRELVAKHRPMGVFFDALGSLTSDELSGEAVVKGIFDFNDKLRADFDLFTWFIHHNRKAQAANKKPNKLSDLYGSQYIGARATTVLGVWPSGNVIEISALKIRLAPPFSGFNIVRMPGLDFQIETVKGLAKTAKVAVDDPGEVGVDNDSGIFGL